MLLGTLEASLLGSLLAEKGIGRTGTGEQWDFQCRLIL